MNSIYQKKAFTVTLDVQDPDGNPVSFVLPANDLEVSKDGKTLDCMFIPGLRADVTLSHRALDISFEAVSRPEETRSSVASIDAPPRHIRDIAMCPEAGEIVGSSFFFRFSRANLRKIPHLPFHENMEVNNNMTMSDRYGFSDSDGVSVWFRASSFNAETQTIAADPMLLPRTMLLYVEGVVHVIHTANWPMTCRTDLKQKMRNPPKLSPELLKLPCVQLMSSLQEYNWNSRNA